LGHKVDDEREMGGVACDWQFERRRGARMADGRRKRGGGIVSVSNPITPIHDYR